MNEERFAFIIHPLDPQRDASRKYPALGHLPAWLIECLSIFYPPVFLSEIKGVRSEATGREAQGWFIACPLSARMMMKLPPTAVYRKIIQSGRYAENLGARLLGLGAFTSVVGDGGETVAEALNIPVTTGNSYTVAVCLHAVHSAMRRLNMDLAETTVAIVGASGAIGNVCARLMAPEAKELILVGRRMHSLERVAAQAIEHGARCIDTTTNIERIQRAQVVLAVSSSLGALIESRHLHQNAIVCDVARPRDVAQQVKRERPDVLVIDGGMVDVPGDVDFGFDFGFPRGQAYACMAETMVLTLENRYESFTLGKRLQLGQVTEIDRMAKKHGFRLGGLRTQDQPLTESELAAHAQRRGEQRNGRYATVPSPLRVTV